MKKSILAVAVVLGATTTFAQDLTSKKGEAYLPEAGDYAVGIDAVPMLNYVGNFFGKTNDNNYANGLWDFNNPNAVIRGKYFVEDQMAYRVGIRLGFGNTKGTDMVADRNQDPANIQFPGTPPAMVENTWKVGGTNIGLTGGLEWRKGSGRLQGFYGAEAGLMLSSSSSTFTYGNALNQNTTGQNVDVDAADDMGFGNLSTDEFGNGSRILSSKSGMMIGFGLRGFIGAEYFVLPKLSLGGEFGWGLGLIAGGTSSVEMESEGLNSGGNEVMATSTIESKNGGSFGLDTDNFNPLFGSVGSVNITFHF